ncbi:MAG: Fic family protein [Kineosporiaceae bacterium]
MEVGHRWRPIEDLSAADEAAASGELPHLASVWHDEKRVMADRAAVDQFTERLHREWAIETGIIERLYTLDRGVTTLLIERGIDASLIEDRSTDSTPEIVAAMINDHLLSIDYLVDLVTGRRPFTTGAIKELHALITRHQRTTTAVDQFGRPFDRELLRGEYKSGPNNPTRADGTIHEYCPPEHVATEMERLVSMHEAHVRSRLPPDVSAAWLHHRFAQIHPFQDGNGRVARALASLVFIQADWFPLVVTRDDRAPYIEALEVADRNGLGALVRLFAARQRKALVGALGITREVTRDAVRLDQQLEAISELFSRRDARRREDTDAASQLADELWSLAHDRLQELRERLEVAMGGRTAGRQAFVTAARNSDSQKRAWHRWQITEAAKLLDYTPGTRDYASWALLGLVTESGRAEILFALHQVGPQYKGVVAGLVCFYRRESADGGRADDPEVTSPDAFLLTYADQANEIRPRFEAWLDESLTRAVECWRRTE